MLKSELIAELEKLDGDMEVVLSSDEEGNHFHRASFVDGGYKFFDQLYELDEIYGPADEDYDEIPGPKFIVIWP